MPASDPSATSAETTPAARRAELYSLLGDLPDRHRPIAVKQTGQTTRDGYVLEHLVLDLNGIEDVPALFVRPQDAKGPLPGVLFNHSHGGAYERGKNELIDAAPYMASPPYAQQLTSMGYCALCIDTWCFGERRHKTELATFKHMLWGGQVMWGMMVYDSLRALDYLVSREDVDSARIATLGMSMGSTMAWWVAALDERVKVCVDICCLTEFQALIDTGAVDKHGLYYYVPGLLKHFTSQQINALIAPRAHLAVAGDRDALTPPVGLERIDAHLRKVYADLGAPQAWRLERHDCGHTETPAMRKQIVAFLKQWL